MRRVIVLSILWLMLPKIAFSAKVDTFFMTLSPPTATSCQAMRTSLAPAASVQVTASRVYFFYLLSDLRKGDTVSTRYYKPGGALYPGAGATQPTYTQSMALGCWWDPVRVSGTEVAGTPGVWAAVVLVNGNALSRITFNVVGATPPPPSTIPPPTIAPPATLPPIPASKQDCVLVITNPLEPGKRTQLEAADVAGIAFERSLNSEYIIGRQGQRSDGMVDIFATTMVIRMVSGQKYRIPLGPWAERPPSNPKIDFHCGSAIR